MRWGLFPQKIIHCVARKKWIGGQGLARNGGLKIKVEVIFISFMNLTLCWEIVES